GSALNVSRPCRSGTGPQCIKRSVSRTQSPQVAAKKAERLRLQQRKEKLILAGVIGVFLSGGVLSVILMTALAAGLALVPLALSRGGPGSEIQTPMAIVILFGLLSSTALNLIVVPAPYLRF
nr:efflux RND transporter permease subunit [Gammaproteobacteria bacterium]